jgi:hypothetical protein
MQANSISLASYIRHFQDETADRIRQACQQLLPFVQTMHSIRENEHLAMLAEQERRQKLNDDIYRDFRNKQNTHQLNLAFNPLHSQQETESAIRDQRTRIDHGYFANQDMLDLSNAFARERGRGQASLQNTIQEHDTLRDLGIHGEQDQRALANTEADLRLRNMLNQEQAGRDSADRFMDNLSIFYSFTIGDSKNQRNEVVKKIEGPTGVLEISPDRHVSALQEITEFRNRNPELATRIFMEFGARNYERDRAEMVRLRSDFDIDAISGRALNRQSGEQRQAINRYRMASKRLIDFEKEFNTFLDTTNVSNIPLRSIYNRLRTNNLEILMDRNTTMRFNEMNTLQRYKYLYDNFLQGD